MAKQKVLSFGNLHMKGFLTRERDDFFSPASRGAEMAVSVRVGLWQNIIVLCCYLLKWGCRFKPAAFNRKGEFKRLAYEL